MKSCTWIAPVLLAVVIATDAVCDAPVDPPAWWNQNDGRTVSLSYNFDTDAWPPEADTFTLNPYDAPLWFQDGFFWEFEDIVPHYTGVWRTSTVGSFGARFDNEYVPAFEKEVFVQFVWFLSVGTPHAIGFSGSDGTSTEITKEEVVPTEPGWYRYTLEFRVTPQPAWEELTLSFDVYHEPGLPEGRVLIDQLHFGAHCSADPASAPKVAVHVLPHLFTRTCTRDFPDNITGCGDIITTEPSHSVDAFPVFYDLAEYQSLDYGLTWPSVYSCIFQSCSEQTIGTIQLPNDGVSHSWSLCQPGPVAVPGWAWMYAYGLVCVVPHPESEAIHVFNCSGRADGVVRNTCAGTDGTSGGDPCAHAATQRTTWGHIKSMFR